MCGKNPPNTHAVAYQCTIQLRPGVEPVNSRQYRMTQPAVSCTRVLGYVTMCNRRRKENSEITTDIDRRLCLLAITAIREGDMEFTSARITTKSHPVASKIRYPENGKVRVEAKMLLPRGTESGTWPAFWMLPTDSVRSDGVCCQHCCWRASFMAFCLGGRPAIYTIYIPCILCIYSMYI